MQIPIYIIKSWSCLSITGHGFKVRAITLKILEKTRGRSDREGVNYMQVQLGEIASKEICAQADGFPSSSSERDIFVCVFLGFSCISFTGTRRNSYLCKTR